MLDDVSVRRAAPTFKIMVSDNDSSKLTICYLVQVLLIRLRRNGAIYILHNNAKGTYNHEYVYVTNTI